MTRMGRIITNGTDNPGYEIFLMNEKVIHDESDHGNDHPDHKNIVGNPHKPELLRQDLPQFILVFQQYRIKILVVSHHIPHGIQILIIIHPDEIAEEIQVNLVVLNIGAGKFTCHDVGPGTQDRNGDGDHADHQQHQDRYDIIRHIADIACQHGDNDGDDNSVDRDQDVGFVVGDGVQVDLVTRRDTEHGIDAARIAETLF